MLNSTFLTCSYLHLYGYDLYIQRKESRQGQRVIIGSDYHLRDDGWQYSLWITSLSISCSNFHARTWIVKLVVAHKVTHVVCNTDNSLCWGHMQR